MPLSLYADFKFPFEVNRGVGQIRTYLNLFCENSLRDELEEDERTKAGNEKYGPDDRDVLPGCRSREAGELTSPGGVRIESNLFVL